MDGLTILILVAIAIIVIGLFGVRLFGLGYDDDDDRYG